MTYFIGIDLGGTNIMAGIVDSDRKLLTKFGLPTPMQASGEELAAVMRSAADTALAQVNLTLADIDSIGVGSPGIVDTQTDSIVFASKTVRFYASICTSREQLHTKTRYGGGWSKI